MGVHHSEETIANLLARVPQATGRTCTEWFNAIDDGPSFTRFDERVHWLQDEHSLPHGMAVAISHEYDRQRLVRRSS
jgi:hypothetical protein